MSIAAARTMTRRIRNRVRVPLALGLATRARSAVAAFALLTGLALLAPAAAEAQSVSVSNLTGTYGGGPGISGNVMRAVAFTTGGAGTARYRLDTVVIDIRIGIVARGDLAVQIRAATSSGAPGSQIGGNLTGTINPSGGNTTYTASGITLNGNTTYFVAVGAISTAIRHIGSTSSSAESGTPGWTIGNSEHTSTNGGNTWSSAGNPLYLKVNATTLMPEPWQTPTLWKLLYSGSPDGEVTQKDNPTGTITVTTTQQGRAGLNGAFYRTVANNKNRFNRPAGVCPSGQTLEYGWYKSSAPTTRLGWVKSFTIQRPRPHRPFPATYYVLSTPSNLGAGQYRALMYCKSGTTYSAPANLMGTNGKVVVTASAMSMSESGPATVTLGAGPDWGSEGKVAEGAVAAIRATRTGSTAAALSIPVKVNPLDTEPEDYDAKDSYTIEFEAGKSEATLEIPTYADADGDDERFNVWMVRYALPEGVVPGDPHHVYVTIEEPGGTQAAPAAPAAVDAASIGVVHNGSSLSASWDAPEGATHYDVTYYAAGAAHARAAWNRAGTSLTIACDSRYPGQKRDCVSAAKAYHVGIRARNDAGESAWVYSAAPAVAPPALSVADATVAEGPLATMDFAVTLSRAATGTVTVDYATRDGTATAATVDYLAASGTLRFAPGETSKTVSVVVMDDAHDEASETLTLVLSNASGAMISDAEATGTITNADPLQRQWLARFGRTVAGQMIDALESRFAMGPGAQSHMTIGGERLDFSGAPPPLHDRWTDGGTGGEALLPETRGMDMRELLLGSSFHFTAGQASGMGAMTGWGKALSGSSSGSPSGGLSFTSETVTGVLGMDWERDNLLVGLALSESVETGAASSGSSGYDLEGSLFMATPYARLRASDRLSFWTMLGSGEGSMRVAYGDARQSADIALQVVAAGGRADLLGPESEVSLALKTDAFFVRTESESVSTPGFGRLAGAVGDASRFRAVLEGSRAFALSGGGSVEPSLTLGLRHDGGDAETGSGVEIGAGLAWSDPSSGLTSELRLYGLAAHEEGGYDEWGASGSLRIAPDPYGRGVSLSMTPSWGAQGQVGRTWDAQPSALAAGGGEPPAARLDTELGYGLFLSDDLTGTPYAGLGFGRDREYRLGWRLSSGRWESFSLGLEATRREAANDDDPAVHDVMLRSALRW